ncbi:hypothetical protein FB451DRAFT_1414161 [Mycena latifolia]|nr:hypothetical protein FB451DRAFT_1414161 [Mycena latifolia]
MASTARVRRKPAPVVDPDDAAFLAAVADDDGERIAALPPRHSFALYAAPPLDPTPPAYSPAPSPSPTSSAHPHYTRRRAQSSAPPTPATPPPTPTRTRLARLLLPHHAHPPPSPTRERVRKHTISAPAPAAFPPGLLPPGLAALSLPPGRPVALRPLELDIEVEVPPLVEGCSSASSASSRASGETDATSPPMSPSSPRGKLFKPAPAPKTAAAKTGTAKPLPLPRSRPPRAPPSRARHACRSSSPAACACRLACYAHAEADVDAEAGGACVRVGASEEANKRRRTLVVFLRHFWCPLCQDYVVALASAVRAACAGAEDSTSPQQDPTMPITTSRTLPSVPTPTSTSGAPSTSTSTSTPPSTSASATSPSPSIPTSTPAAADPSASDPAADPPASDPASLVEPRPETQTQAETPRCPACAAHGGGSVTAAYLESLAAGSAGSASASASGSALGDEEEHGEDAVPGAERTQAERTQDEEHGEHEVGNEEVGEEEEEEGEGDDEEEEHAKFKDWAPRACGAFGCPVADASASASPFPSDPAPRDRAPGVEADDPASSISADQDAQQDPASPAHTEDEYAEEETETHLLLIAPGAHTLAGRYLASFGFPPHLLEGEDGGARRGMDLGDPWPPAGSPASPLNGPTRDQDDSAGEHPQGQREAGGSEGGPGGGGARNGPRRRGKIASVRMVVDPRPAEGVYAALGMGWMGAGGGGGSPPGSPRVPSSSPTPPEEAVQAHGQGREGMVRAPTFAHSPTAPARSPTSALFPRSPTAPVLSSPLSPASLSPAQDTIPAQPATPFLAPAPSDPHAAPHSYVAHRTLAGVGAVLLRALRAGMPLWERGGDIGVLGGEWVFEVGGG